MKTILLSISLALFTATAFGQWGWGVDFESSLYLDRIVIDTAAYPNCVWQIGQPGKTVFNSANSIPNAIVTDTLNPVPPNDTSVFYLKHVRDNIFQPFHVFVLHFMYQMNGDSTDFGTIEISPDTGHTWINLLTEDTTYLMYWQTAKPTLTGSTNGWQSFDLDMTNWASDWGNFPIAMTADTIIFRFTYITDSSSTNSDGWMIDDFVLEDWSEGIPEIQNNNLISLSPNPTSNKLEIQKTKPAENVRVQIMNCTGQILIDNLHFTGENVDVSSLPCGIYFLKYSDDKNFAIKKFIVQHE